MKLFRAEYTRPTLVRPRTCCVAAQTEQEATRIARKLERGFAARLERVRAVPFVVRLR